MTDQVAEFVAVFVDGENLSSAHAGLIADQAQARGKVIARRVYGDATKIPQWEAKPGFRLIHAGTGKNAADVLMAIQAMRFCMNRTIGTAVLCSSDGDFSHLAFALREEGIAVLGIGESKAPDSFRAACTQFFQVAGAKSEGVAPGPPKSETEKPPVAATAKPQPKPAETPKGLALVENSELNELEKFLVNAVSGIGGLPLAQVNILVRKELAIKISETAEKNWRCYFGNRSHLFDLDPRGPDARVRLRRAA